MKVLNSNFGSILKLINRLPIILNISLSTLVVALCYHGNKWGQRLMNTCYPTRITLRDTSYNLHRFPVEPIFFRKSKIYLIHSLTY